MKLFFIMAMKYIIAIDIGGSTFRVGLFSERLDEIDISEQDKIRHYDDKECVTDAILLQIQSIINKNSINKADVLGLGIALPGPLDTKQGIVLNTPNLTIFKDFHIVKYFNEQSGYDVFIENDANLFSLGEWYSQYQKYNIVVGVTIGTGLGFGLIINGQLFRGANGFAMEYGLSPFKWGECEKNVCIKAIKDKSRELYGEEIRPVILEEYYKSNDKKAIKIYDEFGSNLGIVLSHVINMLDPDVISLGGGLSKAFDCFKQSMFEAIKKNVPAFSNRNIMINQSKYGEKSSMLGASIIVKQGKD